VGNTEKKYRVFSTVGEDRLSRSRRNIGIDGVAPRPLTMLGQPKHHSLFLPSKWPGVHDIEFQGGPFPIVTVLLPLPYLTTGAVVSSLGAGKIALFKMLFAHSILKRVNRSALKKKICVYYSENLQRLCFSMSVTPAVLTAPSTLPPA
jgi:hypothetical protein